MASECFTMVATWLLISIVSLFIVYLIVGPIELVIVGLMTFISFVWVFMPVALDIRDSLKKIEGTAKKSGEK